MVALENGIVGLMVVLGWILLTVGLVLTATIVGKSLLIGFAALCVGAVLLIPTLVFPITPSDMLVWVGMGQLGFFSLFPAGLILMASGVNRWRTHRMKDVGAESLGSA